MLKECLDKILSLGRRKPQRPHDQMKALASLFGNPENSFKIIHITGTCGKGSVSTQCANILFHSGYKTGLMSSPNIREYQQRIQVNFQHVPQQFLIDQIINITKLAQQNSIGLSFQIYTLMIALNYFRHQQVDFAVIQVAAGGYSDITNLVNPQVSVITSVGLDHCQLFNTYTIEGIAREKSGVIKPGKPCIVGYNTPQAILRQIACQKQSELVVAGEEELDFFEYNAQVSKTVMRKLIELGFEVKQEALETYCYARPPLRMQNVEFGRFQLVLDVAHNTLGIQNALRKAKSLYLQRRLVVILGVAKHKQVKNHLFLTSQYADAIYLSTWKHSFLRDLDDLKKQAEEIQCPKVEKVEEIDEILRSFDDENSVYVILGSFFLLQGVLNILKELGIEVELTWGLY